MLELELRIRVEIDQKKTDPDPTFRKVQIRFLSIWLDRERWKNEFFSSPKWPIFRHACAPGSELPSNMDLTKNPEPFRIRNFAPRFGDYTI